MFLIEPCCAPKHISALRDAIGNNGTTRFEGYGDLSLAELLPAILTRYSETKLMIVAPSMPDQATDIIWKWMKQKWARSDGNGNVYAIKKMILIANLNQRMSPVASEWMKDHPFGERMELFDVEQQETAILLPDFAIVGPVNMRYGNHFVATATTKKKDVDYLWTRFNALCLPQQCLNKGH